VRFKPTGREVIIVAAVVATASAVAIGLAARNDHRSVGRYVIGAGVVNVDAPGRWEELRRQKQLTLRMGDGICVGGDERPPRERFSSAEVRQTSAAVIVWAVMEEPRGAACFGVGDSRSWNVDVQLSRPIGSRALIEYNGPYQFRYIVLPPRGRDSARRLVLPIRRDRRQPPPALYLGPACDRVAVYLRDVPKRTWCEF
jgi:hypothetical protein